MLFDLPVRWLALSYQRDRSSPWLWPDMPNLSREASRIAAGYVCRTKGSKSLFPTIKSKERFRTISTEA